MIIASTFNKGGVGKTTLAVHAIGVLSQSGSERNLLVDCVDQADAYYFFARKQPSQFLDLYQVTDQLSVINNPKLLQLSKFVDLDEYDNIVIDVNSPAKDTVKVILDNHPDMVLLPINNQALGINNLQTTTGVIAAMEQLAGYKMNSVIVPLGITTSIVENRLSELTEMPKKLVMTDAIANHEVEFATALQNGMFVWDIDVRLAYIREVLSSVLL